MPSSSITRPIPLFSCCLFVRRASCDSFKCAADSRHHLHGPILGTFCAASAIPRRQGVDAIGSRTNVVCWGRGNPPGAARGAIDGPIYSIYSRPRVMLRPERDAKSMVERPRQAKYEHAPPKRRATIGGAGEGLIPRTRRLMGV